MKTELIKNEITRKTIANFFKDILNYKFLSSTKSKYAITSGNYNFYFLTDSLRIEKKKSIVSFLLHYDDIEKIELFAYGERDYELTIFIDIGVFLILKDCAGIELKEKVKEELFNERE